MDLKTQVEKDGYELLLTSNQVILPKGVQIKSGIYNYVSIFLNEEKNDFKIVHQKQVRANPGIFTEWTVEYAKEKLAENHPVLQVVNKLELFKQLDSGLSNIQITPKKPKLRK